ncbi:MAG: DUF1294 domain-containing protein, partial [Hominimerdicola sp.]
MKYIFIYLVIINLLTFSLYGADKAKAKARLWRIPEKTLLILGIAGGFLGGLVGMKFFHHKTRHYYFYVINVFGL